MPSSPVSPAKSPSALAVSTFQANVQMAAAVAQCGRLHEERTELQLNAEKVVEERDRLARENSKLLKEVEKLDKDVCELVALDTATRRRRLNTRTTFMGTWASNDDMDPMELDSVCSPAVSPMVRSDLMQELRESCDWPRRRRTTRGESFGDSLGSSLNVVEEETDGDSPVAISTLAAVGALKAQFLADGFMLERQTLLSRAFLALRLACGNLHAALASRSLGSVKNPLTKAFMAYRAAVHSARAEHTHGALAEKLAAAACHARLTRRRRHGTLDTRGAC